MSPLVFAVGWVLSFVAPTVLAEGSRREEGPSIATGKVPTEVQAKVPVRQPLNPHMLRFAAGAVYRHLFDLSILGGGGELSLGGEGERHGGHANLRFMLGRTIGGLPVRENGLFGTYEIHSGGLRFGPGVGITNLDIGRATNAGSINSTGLTMLVRAGYDFGQPPGAFVLAQYATDLFNGTHVVISGAATLLIGVRF